MQLFSTLKRWWNRHRTGEKTAAILTLLAIIVGVYFGIHTMRSEDASRRAPDRQEAAVTPPAVLAPSPPGGTGGTACPAEGSSLKSNTLALSCEVVSFCTESEKKAPASDDPGYQAYEEQVGREATARYYTRLVALAGRFSASGLRSRKIDSSILDDPDQDCDSLTSAANALLQLANQLKSS